MRSGFFFAATPQPPGSGGQTCLHERTNGVFVFRLISAAIHWPERDLMFKQKYVNDLKGVIAILALKLLSLNITRCSGEAP